MCRAVSIVNTHKVKMGTSETAKEREREKGEREGRSHLLSHEPLFLSLRLLNIFFSLKRLVYAHFTCSCHFYMVMFRSNL